MMRTIRSWAIAGILVPVTFLIIAQLQRGIFEAPRLVFMLWPTSIFLMATDGQEYTLFGVLVFTISIAINVIFYAAIGAMLRVLFGRLSRGL